MNKFNNNNIYMTKTIVEELPEEVLLFIISLVKNMHQEVTEVDYLQVIQIRNNILIHKQEIPEYKKVYTLLTTIKRCKLFFIDNGDYSTLMFSHEY